LNGLFSADDVCILLDANANDIDIASS